MEPAYDVAVVGAGPAGASAALAALRADPRLRVALVDPAEFPRDKTCGDGIAAEAVDELLGLGVPDGAVGGFRPATRMRVSSPAGGVAARSVPRPVWTVPRRVFDERIVAAALAAGAELVRARVRGLTVAGSAVTLTTSAGPGMLRARVVVGADGAHSTVRRGVGAARNPDAHLAVAVRGYADALPESAGEQRIDMVRAGWPAYVWRFPVGDGSSNVGYGCRRDRLVGSGRAALHGVLAERLVGPQPDPATLRAAHLPLSTWRPPQADGPVLLAGDAASLVNPLTGEGIYYAVLSGRLAGEAAAAGGHAPGAAYRDALQRRLGRHLRHTALLARLTPSERFLDAVLAASSRDAAAFEGVVRLGLSDGLVDRRLAGSVARQLLRGLLPAG